MLAEISAIFLLLRISDAATPEVLSCLRLEKSPLESPHSRVVHVEEDRPAYLHCSVPENTNHMVAWSRASDAALLIAGTETFTSDSRFQISIREADYVLIIRQSLPKDSGCYLCEVNTEPDSIIVPVYLNVSRKEPIVPQLMPKKPGKLLANMHGNEVVLNCTFSLDGGGGDEEVHWQKDDKIIDLNNTQKYVWKVKREAGILVHEVVIRGASDADDGEYACVRGRQKATQIVHVNLKAEAQTSRSFERRLTQAISFVSLGFLFV
ncbi:unnamed protein product, partial [Mesorhabditis belari]|uniref:Ig-like domain-containing protein n=1 Tax=Mesorhabditis belari TaxID=2138241 RepID=A0AAF3E9U0_9BILA